MKVTIDIDCTPLEVRAFFGLPDLTAVHSAYIEKMQKAVNEGLTVDGMMDLVKTWGPMSDASAAIWRQMFDQMSGKR